MCPDAGFLSGSAAKNPPAMQEMSVSSLGWGYPLKKEMATHSSILPWRIPWTEEPGGLYSPRGCKESDTAEFLSMDHSFYLLDASEIQLLPVVVFNRPGPGDWS